MSSLVSLLVATILLGGSATYVAAGRDAKAAWGIGIAASVLAAFFGLLVYAAGTAH